MNCPAITDAQRIAEKARKGLRMVALGEDLTLNGWLVYGAALHEGRQLFPKGDNKRFGEWVANVNLAFEIQPHDQAAAIWSAEHPDAYQETRRMNPRVRTLRGLWAKWNEAKKPQPTSKPTFEEPTEADLRRMDMLRNTINHPSTETHLRANAQAKLNDYLERFGKIEPETAKQQLTKKELSAVITRAAMKKAAKHSKAFDILDYAIRHTYGASEAYLEEVLNTLNKLR